MRPAERGLALRHAVALGLLQGPAELLPVSSSGHTSLIPWFAGWPYAQLDGERRKSFEVAVHAGAGLALAIDMRRELLREGARVDRRRAAVMALALAPPALAGYVLGRPIERLLGGPRSIAVGLAAGAVPMALADALGRGAGGAARDLQDVRPRDGLALGVAQASALIPGVSRNGATLTVARARGFDRGAAHALSWHAGLPVLFGAAVLRGARLRRSDLARRERAALALGGASAFLSTLASAALVRRGGLARRSLLPYSLYRCALAAAVLARSRANAGRTYK